MEPTPKTTTPATTTPTPATTPATTPNVWQNIGSAIGGAINTAKTTVTDVYDQVKNHDVASLGGDLSAVLMGMGKTSVQTIQSVSKDLTPLLPKAGSTFDQTVKTVAGPFNPLVSTVEKGISAIGSSKEDIAGGIDTYAAKNFSPTQRALYNFSDIVGQGLEIGAIETAIPESTFAWAGPKWEAALKMAAPFVAQGQLNFDNQGKKNPELLNRIIQAKNDLALSAIFYEGGKMLSKLKEPILKAVAGVKGETYLPPEVRAQFDPKNINVPEDMKGGEVPPEQKQPAKIPTPAPQVKAVGDMMDRIKSGENEDESTD